MSYDLMFQQAIALHEQGRFDEAENFYRQILETSPKNPDVLNLLGLIAQAKGIHNQAVELFYKAILLAPQHAPFYFNIALSLDAWNKPFEALDNYKKALFFQPDIKEAYNNIGTIYKNLGQESEAKKVYLQAIQIDPDFVEPQTNLAMMNKDVKTLTALTIKYPDDALSFYFLAQLNYQQKEYSIALEYISQATKIAPLNDDIKLLSGLIHLGLSNLISAQMDFEKALILNPLCVPALINLANLETNRDNDDSAEAHYKKALDISPSELNAHLNYANFLYLQKRLPEALEEYRCATIINPNIPEISNNLGIIQKDLGEYEEALGLFFNAFIKMPQQEEYSINIAETLVLLFHENSEIALQLAQKWLRQAPDNIFAQHTLSSFQGENNFENNQVYAENLFDHFADNYELVLQNIGYNVVRSLRDFTGNVKGTLVDLGCGTGLAGQAYQTDFTRIIGVDISEKMLEKAREKGCYQELIKIDILEYLKTRPQADLFIAADVFNYIGDLRPIIEAITPQKLAFSTETISTDGNKFTLSPSGRFKHNPNYIEECLKSAGYTNLQKQEITLRTENGQPVTGMLWKAQ